MLIYSLRWRLQLWHGLLLVVVLAAFGLAAYQVTRENQFRRIDEGLEQWLAFALRPPEDRPPPDLFPPDAAPPGRRHWRPGPPPSDPAALRAHLLEALAAATAGVRPTNSFYYVVWEANGRIVARSPGAPLDVPRPHVSSPVSPGPARAGPGPGLGPPPGLPFFVGARTRGPVREAVHGLPQGDCLVVGRSIQPEQAALRALAYGLVVAGAAVLALGLAGGYWLAGRALRPV